MKIYNNDPNLPYKTTVKRPIDSKTDIDSILAKYGIKKVMWNWDVENNNVEMKFQFSEKFKDMKIYPVVQLKPPIIWKAKRRNKPEEIDWRLSMRIFHWYIKNALAWSYANQSERVVAFLPHIMVEEGSTVKDIIIPRLENLRKFKALPESNEENRIIETEFEERG